MCVGPYLGISRGRNSCFGLWEKNVGSVVPAHETWGVDIVTRSCLSEVLRPLLEVDLPSGPCLLGCDVSHLRPPSQTSLRVLSHVAPFAMTTRTVPKT